MLSWQTTSVPVEPTRTTTGGSTATAPTSRGFTSAIALGIHHTSSGSDHLLFLLMLLIPAPLMTAPRRWAGRRGTGEASWRVVHVVTAFAIGHSITLALGALGWIHPPERLVEAGIALSVLVSAVHAIRPLLGRGEVIIAGGFGLLHGLSFAALLGNLDLSRGQLVSTLLGFNLGIELTQLVVVALVMPSLILISRTSAYPALRLTLASVGVVLSASWFAERTGLVASNPFASAVELIVTHPLKLAAELAALAITSVAARRAGIIDTGPVVGTAAQPADAAAR
jgi:hypothetical protein